MLPHPLEKKFKTFSYSEQLPPAKKKITKHGDETCLLSITLATVCSYWAVEMIVCFFDSSNEARSTSSALPSPVISLLVGRSLKNREDHPNGLQDILVCTKGGGK